MTFQRKLFPATLLALAVTAHAQTLPGGLTYPATTKGTQVDVYHGTKLDQVKVGG